MMSQAATKCGFQATVAVAAAAAVVVAGCPQQTPRGVLMQKRAQGEQQRQQLVLPLLAPYSEYQQQKQLRSRVPAGLLLCPAIQGHLMLRETEQEETVAAAAVAPPNV